MLYVAGEERPAHSASLLAAAIERYGLTAVVFTHSAPWRGEMEGVLERHGWQPLASGAYDTWVKAGSHAALAANAVLRP